ncbi:random slug protein 5-like [Quillaja saponaria]|uniref:Random slug protein 5-like n=1 Tax=Quillaja saponaria TaxID=32244 RepID=A0AAD7VDP0_QUISA|nr:random slug protein 5-like [Quillaja saponaria]KAJ7972006.1 random slug protein 5-like [Quillaja saponaria]
MSSIKLIRGSAMEKALAPEEQQAKINEIRKIIGPIADKFPSLCSDASVLRYLRARNWNTKKAAKMLKATLKWRLEYKPEKIQWEDIAKEAETGKLYRADYYDKQGRIVLVMRPGCQNTNSASGQVKHLVYSMENAILNLHSGQEQMVWLIDFQGWNSSNISMKASRETARILQDHYPERLGLAILYNPPKIFESFMTMVKPFLEPKTFKKVHFVYADNPESWKLMEEIFDMDKVECCFGGRSGVQFGYKVYAQKMREDDKKKSDFMDSGCSSSSHLQSVLSESQLSELASDHNSEASDEG